MALALLTVAALTGSIEVVAASVLGVGLTVALLGIGTAFGIKHVLVRLAEQRRALRQLTATLVEADSRVATALAEFTETMADARGAMAEDRVRVYGELNQVTKQLHRLDTAVAKVPRTVTRTVTELLAAAEARGDVRALLSPRAPLPSLGGWSLGAAAMRLMAIEILRRQPRLTVECGSGSSTIWIGYLLERTGSGRLVSLEHDERYAAATRALVVAHGLEDVVDVRLAPLRSWVDATSGESFSWYATEAIDDLHEIGILLVDGPPGRTGLYARYPAGPLLLPRCAADAVVVLDDTDRDDELAVSDRWLAAHPALVRDILTSAPVHVFRIKQEADSAGPGPLPALAKGSGS